LHRDVPLDDENLDSKLTLEEKDEGKKIKHQGNLNLVLASFFRMLTELKPDFVAQQTKSQSGQHLFSSKIFGFYYFKKKNNKKKNQNPICLKFIEVF